jgi:putative transposase
LAQGQSVGAVCRQLEVTEQTYYRRRKEYGGLELVQARRLKDLEKENARLKHLVADRALDNALLPWGGRLRSAAPAPRAAAKPQLVGAS